MFYLLNGTLFTTRLYNHLLLENLHMYSLLDSAILVSCSKLSWKRFARFDPNRFKFAKWNRPTALVLLHWMF